MSNINPGIFPIGGSQAPAREQLPIPEKDYTLSIPTEVWFETFKNLSLKDLKSLRGGNRYMRELVDGYMQGQWTLYNKDESPLEIKQSLKRVKDQNLPLVKKIETVARNIFYHDEVNSINISVSALTKKVKGYSDDATKVLWGALIESHREVLQVEEEAKDWSADKIRNWLTTHQNDLRQITELSLDSKNLKTIPSEIKYFTGLTQLNLHSNNISNLPEDIFANLRDLEGLSLSDNRITNLQEGVFANLQNLKELSLDNNEIRDLPEGIFANLRDLNQLVLGNNHIVDLPEHTFDSLGNLELLLLSDNQITNLQEGVFANLQNLKELYLNNNEISDLPENIFSNLGVLEILQLYGNHINASAEDIFANLQNLQNNPLKDVEE